MRAINHALTGAVIGLSVDNPAISLPASFFSHFVCDMIPHHGPAENDTDITSRNFKITLAIDALLCVLLVAVLFAAKPQNWLVASVCAFLATSPDFLWFKAFKRRNQGIAPNPSKLEIILAGIQWYEAPKGAVVEAAWLVVMTVLLISFL